MSSGLVFTERRHYNACLDVLLLCCVCASCIFYRRVRYRALSLRMRLAPCTYSTFGHLPYPYATLMPNFVSVAPSIAELALGENADTQ